MPEEKSFAESVREELLAATGRTKREMAAELAAICRFSVPKDARERQCACRTESSRLSRKVFTLLKKAFNINGVLSLYRKKQTGKGGYEVRIGSKEDADRFFATCASSVPDTDENEIRSYLRGAYLCSGTVANPEKGYRLEFLCPDGDTAKDILRMLRELGLSGKQTGRKGLCVVYLQDAEQTALMLGHLGARVSYLSYENTRILREMRGSVNRRVNCETSNLQKTVKAAVKQIGDITYLRDNHALASLPPSVREIADLRLRYPEASLGELGTMTRPPIGRSGVNHRLRAIQEAADALRSSNNKGRGNKK